MTGFFVKTAHSVSGPYTGVEIREAALAGIILADTGLGASSAGPWTPAMDAGLFSESKTALPHPPGTRIPLFQVKGMPGAFQGPFKLRELIGFAARGMLPADTLIQSDVSSEWLPARRINVLTACFSRQLFIPGVEPVAVAPVAAVNVAEPEPAKLRADHQVNSARKAASGLEFPAVAPPQWATEMEQEYKPVAEQSPGEQQDDPAERATKTETWRIRLRLRDGVSRPRSSLKLVAIPAAIAAVVLVGFVFTQLGMSRRQIIGDWVHAAEGEVGAAPGFGISFRDNGHCVVFNLHGESWTGDFEWINLKKRQVGFRNITPISAVVAEVSPSDHRDVVQPTDGYIELSGFAGQPPLIGERRFQRCYLRREGEKMRIGYLASVSLSGESRSMEAGWIDAIPATTRPDIAADLKRMPGEPPSPASDSRDDMTRSVSHAITALDTVSEPYGVATRSTIIDGAYLLATYGVPDEARPILTFEVPKVDWDPRLEPYPFAGFQTVRYGSIKFVLSPAGELRFLARASS